MLEIKHFQDFLHPPQKLFEYSASAGLLRELGTLCSCIVSLSIEKTNDVG